MPEPKLASWLSFKDVVEVGRFRRFSDVAHIELAEQDLEEISEAAERFAGANPHVWNGVNPQEHLRPGEN